MKLGGMNKSTAATMKARIPDKLLQSVLLMASPTGRGAVRLSPSLPCFLLSYTQNRLESSIPENA